MSNFIGFDCATKTLAFNICSIDLEKIKNINDDVAELITIVKSLTTDNEDEMCIKIKEIDDRTKQYIKLIDADVVDLSPGRADKEISSIERISLLHNYVEHRIFPNLPANITVIIEDQTINNKSGVIEHALAAMFMGKSQQVDIVNPNIRKDVCFDLINGQHSYFTPKYKTSTAAIKAHSKYNFALTEQYFYSSIPFIKKGLRVHLADSFWQIMGWLKYVQLPPEKQIYSMQYKMLKASTKPKKSKKTKVQGKLKEQIVSKKFTPQIYDD
jgi:hypothetical protein